jgi:general secretion pathway protein M
VSLRDRINQLEDRERRLLGVLILVFGVFVILVIPVGITAYLGSVKADNESVREAIAAINDGRAMLEKRAHERAQVEARYAKKTPALAGYLAGVADKVKVEIPETQDQQAIPHGKSFEERSNKITMRDVGMLALARFMERLAQSGYPVSISRLNIRKRGTKPDSYNVQMTVSAYDRIAKEKPKKQAAPESDEEDEGDEEEDDEEEEE